MADFSVPFPPKRMAGRYCQMPILEHSPRVATRGRRSSSCWPKRPPRVILSADVVFKCQVAADRILPVPLAANYMLTIEAKPKELGFRRNGVSSGWFDANQR